MASYHIHALCPNCRRFHDLLVGVEIDKEFDVYSLADAYEKGVVSPAALVGIDYFVCPVSRNKQPLGATQNMVLVPVNGHRE
jgi:hypothetical protein